MGFLSFMFDDPASQNPQPMETMPVHGRAKRSPNAVLCINPAGPSKGCSSSCKCILSAYLYYVYVYIYIYT
jgi:hypothetical protein